jgi:glycine/D-amino acid oxidase-like deaminating enzyme
MTKNPIDAIIIGGGFYGCAIALYLKTHRGFANVVLLEQGDQILKRASYVNQARVHQGYHYPRSFTTAWRSRVNFPAFLQDYHQSIESDFTKLYAIARRNSQVSARQFIRFCHEIGAVLRPPNPAMVRLFNDRLIERVFEVEEHAFDATILADKMRADMAAAAIDVRYQHHVTAITPVEGGLSVAIADQSPIVSPIVLNCSYAGLAGVTQLQRGLKYEIAEIALMRLPSPLDGMGITVMDGPFFSTMPFPAAGPGLHSLTHVRYTPHLFWTSQQTDLIPEKVLQNFARTSRVDLMRRDAARYVPALARAEYSHSLFDIKVVLQANEVDDGRPILLEQHPDHPGLLSVLGGKIDNIYDIFQGLDTMLANGVCGVKRA